MISNNLEFPCMEASRCYLTERENGMRLTVNKVAEKKGVSNGIYEIGFTKQRNKQNEWYFQVETFTSDEGVTRRGVNFKHVLTGQYLYSAEDGKVATRGYQSASTSWLLEPVVSMKRFQRQSSSSPTSVTKYPTNDVESSFTTFFSLLPKTFTTRRLTFRTKKFEQVSGLDLITTEVGEAAVFELEFTSGELCFISNPLTRNQIRCNLLGKLKLTPSTQGWEVFRFIEVGHGHVAISSWAHEHKYLSSNPDGRVFTSENRLGHWEKWRLEKAESGVHIISVAHTDRYLSIGKDKADPLHTTTRPSDLSKWHLDSAHSHTYHLLSLGHKHPLLVSSQSSGPFLSRNRGEWEEWRLERTRDGDTTLWSKAHQKYLGCNSNGIVHTTSTRGDWSLWEMEESAYGGIFLTSKAHQRVLSVNDEMLCTTVESFSEKETFRLVPKLPDTISGNRMIALGAASAVGLALTVTMPFAIVGAMEAAGLAASELSIMAGVSAEALAGFGGGALLGVGFVQSALSYDADEAQNPTLSPTADAKDDYLVDIKRPISAWRDW